MICAVANDYKVCLEFDVDAESYRQSFGENLKETLANHLVGMHLKEPIITISKLISYEEVEVHADFFEQCAKDYSALASLLMYELADYLKLTINKDFPSLTFDQLKSKKGSSKFKEWKYYVHGFHCGFYNTKTRQEIEASIMCGEEFGELDPYFFTRYILSTPQYLPLPVSIWNLYDDGKRILDKMVELGKFEYISSNWPNKQGIVVKDRNKIEVKVFDASKNYTQKPKFNLLKFLGIKK